MNTNQNRRNLKDSLVINHNLFRKIIKILVQLMTKLSSRNIWPRSKRLVSKAVVRIKILLKTME